MSDQRSEGASNESIAMKKCGIIMPISSIDGCHEGHWAEVMDILNNAIRRAGYEPRLVSNFNEVGVIHKNIIQNLYDDPIVVCDVSGKNPNVMFELGMRLAFDKPAIIVKDDKTAYSFDTSGIQHIEYPRDLRFSRIGAFQSSLTDKIIATARAAADDPNYTTFLKHFGDFIIAKIEKREVSTQDYILEEIRDMKGQMANLIEQIRPTSKSANFRSWGGLGIGGFGKIRILVDDNQELEDLMERYGNVSVQDVNNLFPLDLKFKDDNKQDIRSALAEMDSNARLNYLRHINRMLT